MIVGGVCVGTVQRECPRSDGVVSCRCRQSSMHTERRAGEMELVAWRSAEGQRVVSSESEEEGRVGGGRLGWGGGESSSGIGSGGGEVRVTSETMTMCGVVGGGGGGGGREVVGDVKR